MQNQLIPFEEKELEQYSTFLKDVFYGLTTHQVLNCGRGINLLMRTDLIPYTLLKNVQYNKEKLLLVACYGQKVGLSILESFSYLYIINNRVALYGDGGRILVLKSGLSERYETGYDEEKEEAWCTVQRKKMKFPTTARFSLEDAKKAGLFNSAVWKKYPKRMAENRVAWFALRSQFADVLAGLGNVEEERDKMPSKNNEGNSESYDIILEAIGSPEMSPIITNKEESVNESN